MHIDGNTLLPPEVVEGLAVNAFDTLLHWLKAHAPENVVDLFMSYEGLKNYEHLADKGAPFEMFERYGIVSVAVEAMQAISDLGGQFGDAYGQKHVANNYPHWLELRAELEKKHCELGK